MLLILIRLNVVGGMRLERRLSLSLKNLRDAWTNLEKIYSLYSSWSMTSGVRIMHGLGDRVYAKVYWLVDLRVWLLVWMLLLWSPLRMNNNYLFLLGPSSFLVISVIVSRMIRWIWTTVSFSSSNRIRTRLLNTWCAFSMGRDWYA